MADTGTGAFFFGSLVAVTALLAGCGDDGAGPPVGAELCRVDRECDDGVYCNGVEVCDPDAESADRIGCALGEPPCMAGQSCEEDAQECVTVCEVTEDADGDGSIAIACGGDDCDDADANRFPGNVETCDLEGHDEDCDETTIGDRDSDNDGFVDARCCNGDTCGEDCADGNARVNPTSSEVCDNLDNDCNGSIDEGVQVEGFADDDRDLHGDPSMPIMACPGTPGFATVDDDCDDDNPARHGAQLELCDTIDNDCDGTVDEAPSAVTWYGDADGDGFGSPETAQLISCEPVEGFSLLSTDCDDGRSGVNPAADEQCNGRDDDCNGLADFVIEMGNLEDDDGDGVADMRCAIGQDCDDEDPATFPGAPEVCDGRDNDCDGIGDDGTDSTVWYPDLDRDGYGDPDGTTLMVCEPPPGYVLRSGDCDDSSADINPGVADECDDRDGDCDGVIDEDAERTTFYPDVDEDGYGDSENPVLACQLREGLVSGAGDCDDTTELVSPAVDEVCNSVDDDCDGTVDEGFPTETCGVGACEVTVGLCADGEIISCEPLPPTMADVCDGIDNDCDGVVDDEPTASNSCTDAQTLGSCDAGTCVLTACRPGYANCNSFDPDGCEVDLGSDPAACGSCDTACLPGDSCVDGKCQNQPLEIVAGENHTCVLLGSGDVYCWGQNDQAQLGDGTQTLRNVATHVTGVSDVVALGAGNSHTCAVLSNGRVSCWGRNSNFQGGPTSPDPLLSPTDGMDVNITDALEVDAGSNYTCVRRATGQIRCWGYASFGRLGATCGITNCAGNNTVAVRDITAASLLAVGQDHGIAMVLDPAIEMRAWGNGANGRLGFGGTGDRGTAETMVTAGDQLPIPDAVSVTAGESHSCVVRGSGEVLCTGFNGDGQVARDPGVTDQTLRLNTIVGVAADAVWAGYDHNCARAQTGELYCWGRNQEGQLGVPVSTLEFTPVQVMGLPATTIVDVAAGRNHTCAILGNGLVACWGSNVLGQLGQGDQTPKSGPVFVTGLPGG
jgi:alpha-tubulin suppressor-like RCC1 family protein